MMKIERKLTIILVVLLLIPSTKAFGVLEQLIIPAALYTSFKLQNPIASHLGTAYISYMVASKIEVRLFNRQQTIFEKPEPHNTIFAFDLHDVLVTPDFKKGLRSIVQVPNKLALLTHILKPWFLFDFINLFASTIFEDMVHGLVDKYPALQPIEDTLISIGNAQIPINGTFEIIQELKNQGFKVYLFSNIGQEMFNEFLANNPMLFKNFDEFFVTTKDTDYIHKPHPEVYTLFLQKYNLEPHQVIFIDNSQENIAQANSLGIKGIVFKTVPQLRGVLEEIRALPTFSF